MKFDNTHELQNIFRQIILESENIEEINESWYMDDRKFGKDYIVKAFNGEKWYPYSSNLTDKAKAYVEITKNHKQLFYPISNINRTDGVIEFIAYEQGLVNLEDDNEKQKKTGLDNANNSSLVSNKQLLDTCKGIDKSVKLISTIDGITYEFKWINLNYFANLEQSIVLFGEDDQPKQAEEHKQEVKPNTVDKKDKEIEGLTRWCKSKKPGISDSEARRWAQNIYNKKHGISKHRSSYEPQRYKMTNGDITRWFSADDVYDAKKDGFWIIH